MSYMRNTNTFPSARCVPVSTAEKHETQVLDRDLALSSSQEWADDLLSDVPVYLIIGHLSRMRGAQWEGAGQLNTKRCK